MAHHLHLRELLRDLDGPRLPRGIQAALFAAIDEMNEAHAPVEQIHLASDLSLAAHQYQWAVFNRDADEQAAVRQKIADLGARLLEAIAEPEELTQTDEPRPLSH